MPQGGGALKGIDEKFEVNAANGTASFSVPLPLTPGRNGFGPTLALSYNSGGGNSAFGLGWDIGLLSIQRKTDRQIPQYGQGEKEDTFMFSGVEDLVPVLHESEDWTSKEERYENFTIRRYRPRIEGSFNRIERIDHAAYGTYWKVTTPANTTTFFGPDVDSRISDPENTDQIFQWLPAFSYDDKGNWIRYEYKAEDLAEVPNLPHEKNRRTGLTRFTNRYLKRIKYGNRPAWYADHPYRPTLPEPDTEYFFEAVLDYGEHKNPNDAASMATYQERHSWPARPDAFSSYRSGFEIRTYRRCYGILMFHHFAEEADFGTGYLVRSLDLAYKASSINGSDLAEVSYLQSLTQTGYIQKVG